ATMPEPYPAVAQADLQITLGSGEAARGVRLHELVPATSEAVDSKVLPLRIEEETIRDPELLLVLVEALFVILAGVRARNVLKYEKRSRRLERQVEAPFRWARLRGDHNHVIGHNLAEPAFKRVLDEHFVEDLDLRTLGSEQGQALQSDFALCGVRLGFHEMLPRQASES